MAFELYLERKVQGRLSNELLFYKGGFMSKKKVRVSSILPANIDTIFSKLQAVETLQVITYPYLSFISKDDSESMWQEGSVFKFEIRLFTMFPLGIHTINVEKFDQKSYYVATQEYNQFVPVWHHKIFLESLNDQETKYTDEVELDAGLLTFCVWLWAKLFYRHRQFKWRQILK